MKKLYINEKIVCIFQVTPVQSCNTRVQIENSACAVKILFVLTFYHAFFHVN